VIEAGCFAHTALGNYQWDTTPVVVMLRPMMAPLVEDAITADQRK
jgi:hypothetical protein